MLKQTLKNIYQQITLKHYLFIGALVVFFGTFLIHSNPLDFKAALFSDSKPLPYDGTVLPILKVPHWTSLDQSKWEQNYEQITEFDPLPTYDAKLLKTPVEQLGWQSEEDLKIRNLKITYPAVYMGDYKLDNIEYAGGHLATDIRVPKNTPVYNMGNGVVVKVGNQPDGFGQHVVIKHVNFPDLNNPSKLVTLYSNYCHLSSILVHEGQIVQKGQLIAKSGQSGLASVPHLHFQIDTDDAPWHPYWPFTFEEAQAAHVDFIGAINIGLGKQKSVLVTVNPLQYVQKYLTSTLRGSAVEKSNGSAKTSVPVKPATKILPKPASKTSLNTNSKSLSLLRIFTKGF